MYRECPVPLAVRGATSWIRCNHRCALAAHARATYLRSHRAAGTTAAGCLAASMPERPRIGLARIRFVPVDFPRSGVVVSRKCAAGEKCRHVSQPVRTRFLPRRWIRPLDLVSAIPFAGLFRSRLATFLSGNTAIIVAAVLFSVAHLPNLPLVLATLVWGAVSCLLFRRYRNLYILGLTQGLLGLCLAICVPDAWHHHMRVGLGYLGITQCLDTKSSS